ncbi:MAG: GNAT family N-acetyltransferase [Candidatus Hydrothermarchaeota archaeon]
MKSVSGMIKEFEKIVTLKDGSKVLLRPLRKRDKEKLLEMFLTLSDESTKYLKHDVKNRELIENWINHLNYDHVLPIIGVLEKNGTERIIADSTLHFYKSKQKRSVAWIRISVHQDYQNKGLGTEMINFLIEIGERIGLKRLCLYCVVENLIAIRLFEKTGFTVDGTMKKSFQSRDGRMLDTYLMCRSI